MASLTYLKGDATYPSSDIKGVKAIIHVCNDTFKWGKGFVLALSKRWSQPRKVFMNARQLKLGDIQTVVVEPDIYVVNMIAQSGIHPKNGIPPIRYAALNECLIKVSKDILASGRKVTVVGPRIGSGLAGGRWKDIEKMLLREVVQSGIDVVIYDFDGEEI